MILTTLPTIPVQGQSIRTTNAAEFEPSTAKIGTLWQQFSTELATKLTESSNVYGLYTNYASDHNGAFDVVACASALNPKVTPALESFEIPAGHYLKFSASGTMPDAVIRLWGEVWDYFNNVDCPHQRSYTTDVEHYLSENDVAIYIAVTT
ncbi:GyrI-like domain-containing protein [Pseudidiomarina sediminum]|uniref:GyrI-like domain-containing protein n=1 Tax=Pseudidiomarina sediminum TaxID=431675 RepID=UPI001C95C693|nr:GyrI-like domain-containing protein [Pseudidiomarina sediminum]MBY6063086.1 GyrI-like domain-containing protein [Pseudidiomarina sediminum]